MHNTCLRLTITFCHKSIARKYYLVQNGLSREKSPSQTSQDADHVKADDEKSGEEFVIHDWNAAKDADKSKFDSSDAKSDQAQVRWNHIFHQDIG